MGLIDILKNIFQSNDSDNENFETSKISNFKFADSSSISDDERPYYQPDDYYTMESYPGTMMAQNVITFEERKKTTFPSKNGLYVAEILLLEYCDKGTYPKPINGYPGFWWFEYGIRDIGHALKSLEERGFLTWASKMDLLKSLKVSELKEIAKSFNIKINQKKEDLIKDIKDNVPETQLPEKYFSNKYKLTKLGKEELTENEYVPYMHRHKYKTNETAPLGLSFTVWDMNRKLVDKDKSKWREYIGNVEEEIYGANLATGKNSENEITFKAHIEKDIAGYKSAGIDRYQILAARNDQTCDECRKMDGKIFYVSEAKQGINLPPFHQGCRCTTIAYFEPDEFDEEI